jgi:hypothetical protein
VINKTVERLEEVAECIQGFELQALVEIPSSKSLVVENLPQSSVSEPLNPNLALGVTL